MELKDLGFDDWFEEKSGRTSDSGYGLARVIAVNRDNYIVRNEETEIQAEITGKIRFGAESNLALPAVGDWVHIQVFDDGAMAVIHEILPRKSLLKRKTAGKKIDYQPIASNIDTAFIVQSLDSNFNLRRLERYLTMVNDAGIDPVVLLSKSDLISSRILKQKISEIRSIDDKHDIIAFSNTTGKGLDEVRKLIRRGKTYCLLGSTGVGKTTLLNKLIGEERYATGAVREKDDKGRHVTTRRHLTILEQGGMIIDNPGMRELGSIGVDAGLDETFIDIIRLSEECRFKDCRHMDEPGCAVIEAVKKGDLSKKRYENYLRLRKESEYHEMSYLEKRQKDKAFGKMVKQIMKEIKQSKNPTAPDKNHS